MMPYHNNQLTMIGLDSEDEDYSYPTPGTNKRKRDSVYEMLPQDNFHGDRDGLRKEDVSPFEELTGGGHEEMNPFADSRGVEPAQSNPFTNAEVPVEGDAQASSMYDFQFGNWATDPFAEAHGPFVSDWNLNDYRDNGTTYDNGQLPVEAAAPVNNSTTAVYHFQEGSEGIPVHAGPSTVCRRTTGSPVASGGGAEPIIKDEESDVDAPQVSFTPFGEDESDESDYDDRRPAKVPKLNKDGVPRKPRQPRPKLLKWQDEDWKRVCLGIVWACGDNGIQIPFEQASQVVSPSCTAGALQQALLKLRAKQISEGHQIPALKMAWTRKGRNPAPSKTDANANTSQGTFRKKPTRTVQGQTGIVRLRRPYREVDRLHLPYPYSFTGPSNSNVASNAPAPRPPRSSTWGPPADWFYNASQVHLPLAPNASANPYAADPDPGCLNGMVEAAKDVGRKTKAKAKSVRKRASPAYFKDKYFKKDDRSGPGGASGGGIST